MAVPKARAAQNPAVSLCDGLRGPGVEEQKTGVGLMDSLGLTPSGNLLTEASHCSVVVWRFLGPYEDLAIQFQTCRCTKQINLVT